MKYWMITNYGNPYEVSIQEYKTKKEMLSDYAGWGKYSDVKFIEGKELYLDLEKSNTKKT